MQCEQFQQHENQKNNNHQRMTNKIDEQVGTKEFINAHLIDFVKWKRCDNVQEPIRCQCEYCNLKSSKLMCYVNGKFVLSLFDH